MTSEEVKHVTTCTDEDVRLARGGTSRGTVARCACGWKVSWWIRDGSAESDAHQHMRNVDPEYRAAADERHRLYLIEVAALREKAEAESRQCTPSSKEPKLIFSELKASGVLVGRLRH